MKLPKNENAVRDYLEWSYRWADSLLAAWQFRRQARICADKQFVKSLQDQARIHYMLAKKYKKEISNIRQEL